MRPSNDEAELYTGALVVTTSRSAERTQSRRPAAFVWYRDDGVDWLEPGYADPWGPTSPAYHERRGKWDGRILVTEDELVDVIPIDLQVDAGSVGVDALEWFKREWLDARGTTWPAERDRMRAEIDAQD